MDIDALPGFLSNHAHQLPDAQAAVGVVRVYEETLQEWRSHPNHGGPVRRDERPALDGPPTFQRLSGRLDGLLVAMKWLALPLAGSPGYDPDWRPAVLDK